MGTQAARRAFLLMGCALSLSLAAACGRSKVAPDAEEPDAGAQDIAAPDSADDATHASAIGPCAANGPPPAVVCSAYCSRVTAFCPGQFVDFGACADACNAPTWSCGKPGDTSGDTLYCRITHAIAAMKMPSTAPDECPQAAPDSTTC